MQRVYFDQRSTPFNKQSYIIGRKYIPIFCCRSSVFLQTLDNISFGSFILFPDFRHWALEASIYIRAFDWEELLNDIDFFPSIRKSYLLSRVLAMHTQIQRQT